MAIVIAATTAFATANATTVTTASLTPAAGSLCVAVAALGNGAGVATSVGTMVSSPSLTWTKVASAILSLEGQSEIWIADSPTATAFTTTWDPGGTAASGLGLIVQSLTGAKPVSGQPGATQVVTTTSTIYSDTITPTTLGSMLYGAVGRNASTVVLTALGNTTLLGQFGGSSGDTAGAWRLTSTVSALTSTTFGASNAADTNNQMVCGTEILPAATVTVIKEPPINRARFRASTW